MAGGYTTARILVSGLVQWRLIGPGDISDVAARTAAVVARIPSWDQDPIPVGAAGAFELGEPVTDLHPVAVLATTERVIPYLDEGPLRSQLSALQQACVEGLAGDELDPLTVAGGDYGAPAYRHSPLYRTAATGQMTEMAAVPRRDTDPDLVAAPIDFARAPDLILYRPVRTDTAPVTSYRHALAHLEQLGRHCDRDHAAGPYPRSRAFGGSWWSAGFAVHADPLINTLREWTQPWLIASNLNRGNFEVVVAALAHYETLPRPAERIVHTTALVDQWLEMRGRDPDYLLIEPDGVLTHHHRHPNVSPATVIGRRLGADLQIRRGPAARLWHKPAGLPREVNPLAERVARALDIPYPAAGLRGPVAISMDPTDLHLPHRALTPALTRQIYHQLAGWRADLPQVAATPHQGGLSAVIRARLHSLGFGVADGDGGEAGTVAAVNAARPHPREHTADSVTPASGPVQDSDLPAPDGEMSLGGA
ncbi:hypothetical protein ACWDUL_38415 [Nocardia niigatensis]